MAFYNKWANDRVLKSLMAQPGSDAVWSKLSHIVLAESVWLMRLNGALPNVNIFALLNPIEVQAIMDNNNTGWKAYIEKQADFSGTVSYLQMDGTQSQSTISDILTHIFNHGTYHRGQIATLMRQDEQEPVVTDFIGFSRLGN
jgi:uncharacterized damage-inducible protein DinB